MKHVLAATVCVLAAPGLHAAQPRGATDFGYSLSLGATRTDNAGLTRTDRESETSLEAGLGANLRREGDRVDAGLTADLAYRSHDYGDYEDELLGGLDAEASFRLARWLRWTARDNFGQSLIDSRNTATPANTQNTNFFSTGPDIQLSLGTRTNLLLQGRWSDVAYEESEFGSRRGSGSVGLQRRFSARSAASINGSTEHVDYKSLPTSSNYDIRSAFLQWDVTGARTALNLRAGVTKLEQSGETQDGTLLGLDLQREITGRSTLSLDAGRSFGSSADLLRRDQGLGDVGTGDRPGTAVRDPQRADHSRLSWAFRGERMSVTATARWERESHRENQDLDHTLLGGSLQASRQIGPRVTLDLAADIFREEFDNVAIEATEWSAGLGLQWAATRSLSFGADWDHLVGDGDTTFGAETRNYTENRYTLRLIWSPVR